MISPSFMFGKASNIKNTIASRSFVIFLASSVFESSAIFQTTFSNCLAPWQFAPSFSLLCLNLMTLEYYFGSTITLRMSWYIYIYIYIYLFKNKRPVTKYHRTDTISMPGVTWNITIHLFFINDPFLTLAPKIV